MAPKQLFFKMAPKQRFSKMAVAAKAVNQMSK
jgi:hypothetical protein